MRRVKIGIRVPSLKKRIAARRSGLPGGKRFWRHRVGLKAPRGMGWMTNPKRFVYNKIYRRTTRGLGSLIGVALAVFAVVLIADVLAKIVVILMTVLAAAAAVAAVCIGTLLIVALFFPWTRKTILNARRTALAPLGRAFGRRRRRRK